MGSVYRRDTRLLALMTALIMFVSLLTVPAADARAARVLQRAASGDTQIAVADGALEIYYSTDSTAKLKLRIAAEGSSKYTNYDIAANKKQRLSLKSSATSYTVQICEHISGTKYRIAYETVVSVGGVLGGQTQSSGQASQSQSQAADTETYVDPNNPYLASVDRINWSSNMACIQKAQELAAGKKGSRAKAEAIYNYLVGRMSYDFSKVGKLPSSYRPDLESVYSSRQGICYDIAALYAGMLRSVGVPAKLVMGYTSMVEGYHAWNQVDLGGGQWQNVDVTTDCQLRGYGESVSFSSPKGTFSVSKEY